MKKRVLITGIGGSIGVHVLAHIMHNTNWDVIGLDSFKEKHKGMTDRVYMVKRNHPDWESRIKIFVHDLRASISPMLRDKMGKIDYIIHLASRSDVDNSIKEPEQFILDNIESTLSTLKYAREIWGLTEDNQKAPKGTAFVMFSTDEVYGPSGENDGHAEWSTILPSNPYSASKACQEAAAISYWRTFGLPLIITNTMNNFGEMQQSQKFPVMVQKAVNAGKQVIIHGTKSKVGSRYYLHSRNAADALLFILNNTKPNSHKSGEIDRPSRFNIVGDKRMTNLELAKTIAEIMGKPLKFKYVDFHKTRPGHDRHYGLDGKKLKKLGWKSPVPFKDSLKETIAWQERHPQW